jgi:hypothetical protein
VSSKATSWAAFASKSSAQNLRIGTVGLHGLHRLMSGDFSTKRVLSGTRFRIAAGPSIDFPECDVWPNKSLQPTATAVMPPAAQEITPAVGVAEH